MHEQNLVFAQLTKVDEDKRLVYGRAVQETPDRSGEIFDYESSKPMFEAWSKSQSDASMGKSDGNVRAMHKDISAGVIVPGGMVFHDDEMAIDICAKVIDDNEWEKVIGGAYTGFSIGGRYAKKWEDSDLGKTRYTADPSEVSLVDRPCVPTATFFEIQKADGSVLQKNFAESIEDKAAEEIIEEVVEKVEIEEAVIESDDVLAKSEDTGQKQDEEVPPQGVAKADEPVQYEVAGSDDEVIEFAKILNEQKLTMADAIAALKKVAERDDTSPKEGKAKYGNVKFADEKNKKYPIDTEAHIRAAWNYINKPKNAGKYSEDDVKGIKSAIVAAWKDKIDKDGPPAAEDSKKVDDYGDLRKGLLSCADFAHIIQALVRLTEAVEYEAAAEGDGSQLPAKLTNAIADLGDILVAMVQEEIDEEVNGTEAKDQEPRPVMAMAEAIQDMQKRIEPLRKVGAKHSKETLSKIQSLHDHSVELGAACAATKMVKSDDTEALAKLQSDNDGLAKLVSEAAETIKNLSADVEMYKAMPKPSKARLMVVTKGQDIGIEIEQKEVEPIRKHDGSIDEAATALKKVFLAGGQPLRAMT
jgi:hypothetical protein